MTISRRSPSRLTLLIPAFVCLSVAIAMTIQVSRRLHDDLYWTPADQAPTLEEARPRVEISLDGELLQRQAEAGQLLRPDGSAVSPEELRVRFNNVDGVVRAQLIVLSASLAAGVALLAASFMLPRRRSSPAVEALNSSAVP